MRLVAWKKGKLRELRMMRKLLRAELVESVKKMEEMAAKLGLQQGKQQPQSETGESSGTK